MSIIFPHVKEMDQKSTFDGLIDEEMDDRQNDI